MQSFKYWIEAARLKTLPASVSPVLLGSSIAFSDKHFQPLAMFYCLVFAILCQIGTNFSNDYLDAKKGADSEQRIGPRRLVASGIIKPKTMLMASIVSLALAFFIGLNLVPYGGQWLLVIGILSIVFAWCYTGGPYPLAYNALGDVFVILFFGLIAVSMTYYVQAQSCTVIVLINGLSCGLFINNLLLINNIRDYKEDLSHSKRTTIVVWGTDFGLNAYTFSLIAVFATALINYTQSASLFHFLIIIPLLVSAHVRNRLRSAHSKNDFNALLKKTGIAVLLYGIFASLGFILS